MHVLVIPSWYPSPANPLVGSFFREQVHALHANGVQVGVLHVKLRPLKEILTILKNPKGVRCTSDGGVPTFEFYGIGIPRLFRVNVFLMKTIGLLLFYKYLMKHGMPDVVHVHSMNMAGIIALELKEKYNLPYVVTEHSSVFNREYGNTTLLKTLIPVVQKSSYCMAVSKEFSSFLTEIFLDKSIWHFSPNMVSDTFLKYPIKKTKKTVYSFICVAFLTPNKAIDNLIEAFSLSFDEQNIELNIVGDGPELGRLKALASGKKCKDRIHFWGRCSRDQVVTRLAESDVLVVSSLYETFGVVVLEALALGKPVVSTRCGGPESILEPGDGILVPPNNIEELARGMNYMYMSKKSFDPEDIRQRCAKRFGEKAHVLQLQGIYKTILDTKKAL